MSRTFAYCRVSTLDQTTENQILAIRQAGYEVLENRVISETISGKTPALTRPLFKKLVEDKLEPGDTLIVNKIDRLGRDNIDVQTTVTSVLAKGIKLISIDLPIKDLSSAEGKLMLGMFSVFAEFERNRISDRTKEGQARAIAQGRRVGRPIAIQTNRRVQQCKQEGLSQSKTSQRLGIGIATVKRHWNTNFSQ